MNFRSLASGSSGNAYLLTFGEESVLIECGIPWKKVQEAMHFNTRRIRFCLVSHSHADHAGHIKEVLKAGIDVYGPSDIQDTWRICSHRFQFLHPEETVGGMGLIAKSFECVHDVPCYGWIIAHHGRDSWKAVYLPDTSYSPVRFGPGITHFLLSVNWSHETLSKDLNQKYRRHVLSSHMSLDTCKKLLMANDLSAVQEIHLLHLSDVNSDAEYFKSEVQKLTGKPVYVH